MFQKESIREVDLSIRNVVQKLFEKRTKELLQLLLDSPTQYQVTPKYDFSRLHVGNLKKRHMIGLAILSWYLPDELRFLVQLELEDTWDPESKEIGGVLLTSKDYAITWLISISRYTESEFFGNVLNKELASLWSSVDFHRNPRSYVEKYTGYCRGYQESNRRSPSSRLSSRYWASMTVEEQIQREIIQEQKTTELFLLVEEEFKQLCLVDDLLDLSEQLRQGTLVL